MAVGRKLLVSVAAWLLLAAGVRAQDGKDQPIDRAQREQDVARQAFEEQIQAALDQAAKQSDAAKAEELLRDALKKVEEDDTYLSIVRRASLKQSIKERLEKLTGGNAAAAGKGAKEPPAASGRDEETIRGSLDQISALRQQGKLSEAQKAADDLARRYPSNALVKQVRNNLALADQVGESRRVAQDVAEGGRLALNSVSRAATPIAGDIQYPPKEKWAEIQKRKEKYTGPNLTDKEKEILKTLASMVDERVELKEQPLETVLEYLQKLLGQEFRIDKKAIDELNLTYETPINVSLPRGLTKRTVMRRILNDLGLTYIIKEERIEVTSVERANTEITTMTYQIDDLLGFSSPTTFRFGGPGPGQTDGMVKYLIDLIQSQVEPNSWEKNGGPGTISYFAGTRTLIVRNTSEVHALMGFGSKKKK